MSNPSSELLYRVKPQHVRLVPLTRFFNALLTFFSFKVKDVVAHTRFESVSYLRFIFGLVLV